MFFGGTETCLLEFSIEHPTATVLGGLPVHCCDSSFITNYTLPIQNTAGRVLLGVLAIHLQKAKIVSANRPGSVILPTIEKIRGENVSLRGSMLPKHRVGASYFFHLEMIR